MSCVSCSTQKSLCECGLCQVQVCKTCAFFLDPDAFRYSLTATAELKKQVYCPSCYHSTVEEALVQYEKDLEKAKAVHIYAKAQSKETRLMSRKEKALVIPVAQDESDVFMRLAFQAVKLGCNAVIDVETKAAKSHQGSYVLTTWSGRGIPASIRE